MKDKNLIIVEGKSDTAKLKTYFDVETIETNGSAVDKDVLTLIKQASLTHNIIIFTDPDGPGEKIRKIVSAALNNDCYHAFVPKAKAISKNKVGIAETNRDDLADALLKVMKFSTNLESISFSEFKLSQSAINRKLRN